MHLIEDEESEVWALEDARSGFAGREIDFAAQTCRIGAVQLPLGDFPGSSQRLDASGKDSFIGGEGGGTEWAEAFCGLKEIEIQKSGVEEWFERRKEEWVQISGYT